MNSVVRLLVLFLVPVVVASAGAAEVRSVRANGVELHYIEQGRGDPVVLLHGGQGDYRSWAPQMAALARHYRVIAYSRRFHHPNDNPPTPDYRAAYTDAADLHAFVQCLQLERAHIIGTSAGALTALVMATQHPGSVRSLVLAEPPVHRWARDAPRGRALYDDFMATTWRPAGAAFRAGNTPQGMKILVDGFGGAGTFDAMKPAARETALQNARFFEVATASADPFPAVSGEAVAALRMPILILRGEHTVPLHAFVNDELQRLLPHAQSKTIHGAGHGAAREQPEAFNQAVLAFLQGQGADNAGASTPPVRPACVTPLDRSTRQPR